LTPRLAPADHSNVPSKVPARDKRDRRILVRVTEAVYETIALVAAADRREVATWVAMVVEDAAERAARKLKGKAKPEK
jgi:predicted HicB family RNase H-like nuclease